MTDTSACDFTPSAASSLFSASPSFLERLGEAKEQCPEDKRELAGDSEAAASPEKADAKDNNQEDDTDASWPLSEAPGAPPFFITNSMVSPVLHDCQQDDGDYSRLGIHHLEQRELERLRKENAALTQHVRSLEKRYERRVYRLQKQLQQVRSTHREAEQRWKAHLRGIQDEKRATAENVRELQVILVRISSWAHRLQKAARVAQPPLQSATAVPPISPWTVGTSHNTEWGTPMLQAPATPFSKRHESTAPSNSFRWRPSHFSTEQLPDIDSRHACPSPPPAPGRSRSPKVLHQGFKPHPSRAQYVAPACKLAVDEVEEIILNGFTLDDESAAFGTAPCRSAPPAKRRMDGLLAYCTDLVVSSLSGARSSPPPNSKVMPVWKFERLPLRNEPASNQQPKNETSTSQNFNIGVPTLSLGLL